MPIYAYKCTGCGTKRDIFKPIADLDRVEACTDCDFVMRRQVAAPMVLGDYPPYECPITGKLIEGRRAHLENLKQHGCRVLEPGETDAVRRNAAAADAALDKSVENTAEEFVATLPSVKREKLIAELEGGLDVQVTRN